MKQLARIYGVQGGVLGSYLVREIWRSGPGAESPAWEYGKYEGFGWCPLARQIRQTPFFLKFSNLSHPLTKTNTSEINFS